MIIINSISNDLKNRLPPCLDSMMKQVVDMVENAWIAKGNIGIATRGKDGFEVTTGPKSSIALLGQKAIALATHAAKTTFTHERLKPGAEGLHYFWNENGLSCEILSARGSRDYIKYCYEGPFKGTLLSKACLGDLSISHESRTEWLPSATKVAGYGIGAFAIMKSVDHLMHGNTSKALLWCSVAVACLAIR